MKTFLGFDIYQNPVFVGSTVLHTAKSFGFGTVLDSTDAYKDEPAVTVSYASEPNWQNRLSRLVVVDRQVQVGDCVDHTDKPYLRGGIVTELGVSYKGEPAALVDYPNVGIHRNRLSCMVPAGTGVDPVQQEEDYEEEQVIEIPVGEKTVTITINVK